MSLMPLSVITTSGWKAMASCAKVPNENWRSRPVPGVDHLPFLAGPQLERPLEGPSERGLRAAAPTRERHAVAEQDRAPDGLFAAIFGSGPRQPQLLMTVGTQLPSS